MTCRRWYCPACGFFGLRARRRARAADDAAHIVWATQIGAEARRCTRCPSWVMQHERGYCAHAWTTNYGALLEQWNTILRADMVAVARHAEERRARFAASLAAYDTGDIVAEVVGPLSYEEQSEMIGDPIADVIRRETE